MALSEISRTRMDLRRAARIFMALVALVALIQVETAQSAKINTQSSEATPARHGTVEASERLMKEFKDIYKSDGFKNGIFSVELVNDDNLYEWNVKLFILEPGQLHKDFQKFKKNDQEPDHILLRMSFNDNYPYEPPFVRVIYPVLIQGIVFEHGELCMEMLTKQGWVKAYDAETLIVSIMELLAETKVDSSKGMKDIRKHYTLEQAQEGFRRKSKLHEEHGWD